uniref:Translation elongation factor EFTu/EF1A C-terminal domain-containing protein n=1 Tax=Hucho hucho TaxID=62062 RepID=A0A4W5LIH4_9TELE
MKYCCTVYRNFGTFLILKHEKTFGEKAVVCFKFIKHPEYLKVGAKLLFREGATKGIGQVTKLQPVSQSQPSQSEEEDEA